MNSGVLHMTKLPEQRASHCTQLLHLFDLPLVTGHEGSRIDQKYVLPFVQYSKPDIIPLYKNNPKHNMILYKFKDSFLVSERDIGYEIRLRSYLSDMILDLIMLSEPRHEDVRIPKKKMDERVKGMLAYIHEHYGEKITIQPLLALEDPIYVWDEFCFTSNLTDLDLGARFLEAYYSDEHIDLINFGTEGYNYEMVDGEKVYKQYTATEDGKLFQADTLNQYIEDKAAQKLLFGKHLYSRAITSDYTYYNLDDDAETSLNKGYAAPKYYFQQETLDYGHWTSIDATGVWATADPEDVEESI